MNARTLAAMLSGLSRRCLCLMDRPGAVTPASLRVQVLLAGALLLIAGSAGAKIFQHDAQELPDDAVLRVDETVVTTQQFTQRATLVEFLYGVAEPAAPAKVDDFNRTLAKAVAVSLIVEEAARERNIAIADKAASDRLERLIWDSGMDRRAFIQHLGSRGLTERDVLDEIKFQQVNARLFAEVTKDVSPTTDADAKRYFHDHRAEMVAPETRGLVNIVVSSEDQARRVARLARSGDDFSTLVDRYSIDESTRTNGGSLGVVLAEQLETGYAAAAFAAGKGEVFGPVQTAHGWNVGRVTQVQRPVPVSFTRIKDALKSRLDYEATLRVWNEFLAERIREAHVVYAPDYRPDDPYSLPSPPPGG